jgi:hypothetical protein
VKRLAGEYGGFQVIILGQAKQVIMVLSRVLGNKGLLRWKYIV